MNGEDIIAAYDKAISIVHDFESRPQIGDDIYSIPSEANYKLNVLHNHAELNKVYHQQVARICIIESGWYIEGNINMEHGLIDRVFVDRHYGVTWFKDEHKAQEALNKLGGNTVCVPLMQSDSERK